MSDLRDYNLNDPLPIDAAKGLASTDRLDQALDALQKIKSWAEAYPVDIFPEPDMKRVRELLAAGGITIDAVSASNMRHVLTRVGEIAKEGLGE